RASTSRPTWTAGDYWTYAFRASLPGQTYNGTLTLTVLGTESVSVNGSSYSSYHVRGTIGVAFGGGSFSFQGDVWYNVATLAIVEITAVVSITGSVTITISGNPPQDIHWPLTTNDAWSSSTAITEKQVLPNGTANYLYTKLSTNFNVLADTTVTVPAGTFSTTPLKETSMGSNAYVVNYWSPQTGNSVRSESYNGSGGGPSGGYNLTAYNYQGGSFFTSIFLGLQLWIWLLLLLVVVVAIVGTVVIRRRKPPAMVAPPWTPPQQPPAGPPP
ncbi:MAG: hypothetical protein L3J78_01375, partial [Thermoplasmata archaeon]|nr:hypothetical protein [Thermoplasmata archaeon]